MSQATMKALVKREAAPGIWMEQVPVPEIGPNDVEGDDGIRPGDSNGSAGPGGAYATASGSVKRTLRGLSLAGARGLSLAGALGLSLAGARGLSATTAVPDAPSRSAISRARPG